MPQVATTVTPYVKVEELRVIEISFYDHEYYAGGQLIATITHDDDLTQPWLVIVNDKEVHRAATLMLCHRFICQQYKRGTLSVQEKTPVATTGNEVMCEIAAQCEQFGFELLDDGIYKDEQKLGSIGCTEGKWWVIRATSVHQQKIPCDSALDAVWVLSMVELTQPSCKKLLDKPFESFDQLTADEWEQLRQYQPPSNDSLNCGGFTDSDFARIEGMAA